MHFEIVQPISRLVLKYETTFVTFNIIRYHAKFLRRWANSFDTFRGTFCRFYSFHRGYACGLLEYVYKLPPVQVTGPIDPTAHTCTDTYCMYVCSERFFVTSWTTAPLCISWNACRGTLKQNVPNVI